MTKTSLTALFVSVTLLLGAATLLAKGQPEGDRGALGWETMGPGMIGPGMTGRGGFRRICHAGSSGWRTDRLEQSLELTDAQRAKFDEFKAASEKATEAARAACPSQTASTTIGHVLALEKRLDAMALAVRTIRPSLEAFYATLSDEQKAKLDTSTARRPQSWRWHSHG
jgi:Spy/CpxP family protein refolding chaperone